MEPHYYISCIMEPIICIMEPFRGNGFSVLVHLTELLCTEPMGHEPMATGFIKLSYTIL